MDGRRILARNVRSLMKQADISSQVHLARVTGISQTQIGNILRERKGASIDTLERLAEGLGCDPYLLLAPVTILEQFEVLEFAPLVHCFMRLPYDDQLTVWGLTHDLFESSNGFYFSRN